MIFSIITSLYNAIHRREYTLRQVTHVPTAPRFFGARSFSLSSPISILTCVFPRMAANES